MDHGSTTYDQEQQRMDALAAANETRRSRARMKRDLKAGRVRAQKLILDPPWYVESMGIMELLMALPKHGRVRAAKLLHDADLPLAKTVGSTTERQRQLLVEAMGS